MKRGKVDISNADSPAHDAMAEAVSDEGDDLVRHQCVCAILRSGRRVLLCHRSPVRDWFPDVWDLPGGHVEVGESEPEALARELQEELGVVVGPPEEPPFEFLRSDDGTIELTVWLLDFEGPILNRSSAEHDVIRWVTAEELAGLPLADDAYLPLVLRALP